MGSPRRFFIALPAGLILVLGTYLGLFRFQLGAPTESSRWCYEITRQKHDLSQAIPGPRILLVGGSSVHFGMSARLISEVTGKPAINFGNHAALGPAYMFHVLKHTVRAGDTVLLALEYESFGPNGTDSPGWDDPQYLDYISSRDPAYFLDLPLREQFELSMIMQQTRLLQGVKCKFRPEPKVELGPPYDVTQVNAYGDLKGHTYARRPTNAPAIQVPIKLLLKGPPPTDAGWAPIADFCQWARTNGIRVLATFPPVVSQSGYNQPAAQRTIDRIGAFYQRLQVPVLEPARSLILPAGQFYDTRYHLVEEEQMARTIRLIPLLMEQLSKPADPGHTPAVNR